MTRTLAYTIAACLLIDATAYTASQASRVHDGTQVLTVALLAAGALVAVCAAAAAAASAAWFAVSAAMYARRLARRQPPPEPETWAPVGYTPSARFDPYWAAVTARVAEVEPGDYRPYDGAHAAPLPKTKPMPVEELAGGGVR